MESQASFNVADTKTKGFVRKYGLYAVIILVALLFVAVAADQSPTGVSDPLLPNPGTVCTVLFCQDAMGFQSTERIEILHSLNNGLERIPRSFQGKFIASTCSAVLFERTSRNSPKKMWIPKSSVLFIEY